MKRRWKILTAILLSAAMTATSLSPGFASEAVPDGEAGLASEETVITETEEQQDESSQGSDDQSGEQTPESSNETTITGSGEQDDENTEADQPEDAEDQDGADEMDEASDNDAPAADDASGEDDNDTVSDSVIDVVLDGEDVEKTITEHQFIHEYDGKAYNPGKYKISTGQKVRGEAKKDAAVLYTGPKEFDLKSVTTVSDSYIWYIYPSDAQKDTDYTETINVSVTPRPVTYRSKTYTKQMDGKPLSQNLAEPDDLPKCVRGTMAGEQKFKFNFDPNAKQIEVGSSKNKFTVSNSATADVKNYDVSYEYGNLIVTASRNTVNGLPTPMKAKAIVQNTGSIKITWKKVKSYKETGKKGGKTRYRVCKYKEDDTWIDLGEPVTKCSVIDSNPTEGERFIYKIIPIGYDSSGVYGEAEQPAYVRATPKIVSVSPYDGINYAKVTFMGLGTDLDKYTLEHWNTKAKGVKDQITVDKYNSDLDTYKSKKRGISVNSYLDAGGDSVTISGNNKSMFVFRVMADETTVYDYGSAVTVQPSAWSKMAKLKMISMAPLLKGKRESNTSFKLKWNKIAKATGYLIEYSTDKNFKASETRSVYVSKKEKQSNYNEREYTVKDVGTGIPYYCKVTAYNKKKSDGSAYGIALGTSNTLIEYGRQKAVKNLEAEYFEDGNDRADAKLTWEDDEEGVKGYYVQKWSYEYNPSTKAYDKQTKYEVLQDYTSGNATKKKYASTVGNKVVNGELVKYRVQSVKYLGGKLGEFRDGYVFGEPSEYYYMNPTETQFKKKKYTVAKGSELDMSKALKFKPTKKPKKADGLTQSEFKEIFCFNDEMKYVLQSDELTNSKIKEYVTVTVAEGKLKGVKKYTKSAIKLKAYSPNDPENVYATTQINVGDASDEEEGGSGGGGSSGTIVCIDAGHGGDDPGAQKNGIKEKDMNLTIAKKVGSELKSLGLKVVYTRDEDKEVSLTKRTDIAKDKGCALFVSIHCNSSDDSSANGTEVYYSVESKYAKKGLAEKISEAVSSKLGTKNIGAKTRKGSDGDYYSVIRTSAQKGIPGLIVEHAFISNSSDASKLQDSDKLDAMAKAEAKAIYNSLK